MSTKLLLPILLCFLGLAPQLSAIVVTGVNPNDPLYLSSVTAVGTSSFGGGLCSGSLLSTGMHFLTAAHCVLDSSGNPLGGSATITFTNDLNQSFAYQSIASSAHPSFQANNYTGGFDLAIITLNAVVDSSIGRLSLYQGTGEMGATGTVIGYGRTGTGLTGSLAGTFGTRHQGLNVVDDILTNNILFFDFDSGAPQNNTLGNTGLGASEVMVALGDSGGPTLIGGQIAGIHSFITCVASPFPGQICLSPPDVDNLNNSSFGERFGDTRISTYNTWIQGVVDPASIPEPSTVAAGLCAAVTCLLRSRRTRNGSSS